jgi:hypothetical protein
VTRDFLTSPERMLNTNGAPPANFHTSELNRSHRSDPVTHLCGILLVRVEAQRCRYKLRRTSLERFTNGLTSTWTMICRFPYWPIKQE